MDIKKLYADVKRMLTNTVVKFSIYLLFPLLYAILGMTTLVKESSCTDSFVLFVFVVLTIVSFIEAGCLAVYTIVYLRRYIRNDTTYYTYERFDVSIQWYRIIAHGIWVVLAVIFFLQDQCKNSMYEKMMIAIFVFSFLYFQASIVRHFSQK